MNRREFREIKYCKECGRHLGWKKNKRDMLSKNFICSNCSERIYRDALEKEAFKEYKKLIKEFKEIEKNSNDIYEALMKFKERNNE